MFNRSRAIAVAVMGLCMGAMSPAIPSSRVIQPVENVSPKVKKGLFNGRAKSSWTTLIGTRGSSVSAAQQKRASAKRRNVMRNRSLQKR